MPQSKNSFTYLFNNFHNVSWAIEQYLKCNIYFDLQNTESNIPLISLTKAELLCKQQQKQQGNPLDVLVKVGREIYTDVSEFLTLIRAPILGASVKSVRQIVRRPQLNAERRRSIFTNMYTLQEECKWSVEWSTLRGA